MHISYNISDNVIMVTLGTGVGGGIIVDGKIVAGTPVPSVTMMTLSEPAAAPFHASPRAATLASFPAHALSPVRS